MKMRMLLIGTKVYLYGLEYRNLGGVENTSQMNPLRAMIT